MNKLPIIDAHSHIWSKEYDHDRKEILQKAQNNEILGLIEVGCDLISSKKALELSKDYSFIYPVCGLHPHDANKIDLEWESISELASNKNFIGIGEIGLDYNRMHSSQEEQRRAFKAQLRLAVELKLPVVIHSRDADNETFSILKNWKKKAGNYLGKDREIGMMHCFASDYKLAIEYIDLGFMISVPGTVTYPNNIKLHKTVKNIPLEKILIETDTPYLTPIPNRGKRNESEFIKYTLKKVIELRKNNPEFIANTIFNNTKQLFNINIFERNYND